MDESMMDLNFDYAAMDLEERPFARRLADYISTEYPGAVIDLGAGTGVYVEELLNVGVPAHGYDPTELQTRPDLVTTCDMQEVDSTAPVVLCLEVAEHIPEDQSGQVVESLWRCCEPGGHVIFSAAPPGQGGVGHINCQPPEYWRKLALAQGFTVSSYQEWRMDQWIRSGYHMGWFAQNRQIWCRPD
jgi:SAM-dependent methyltransferase